MLITIAGITKNNAAIDMPKYIKPTKRMNSPKFFLYLASKINKGEITFPLLSSTGIVHIAIVVPTLR